MLLAPVLIIFIFQFFLVLNSPTRKPSSSVSEYRFPLSLGDRFVYFLNVNMMLRKCQIWQAVPLDRQFSFLFFAGPFKQAWYACWLFYLRCYRLYKVKLYPQRSWFAFEWKKWAFFVSYWMTHVGAHWSIRTSVVNGLEESAEIVFWRVCDSQDIRRLLRFTFWRIFLHQDRLRLFTNSCHCILSETCALKANLTSKWSIAFQY